MKITVINDFPIYPPRHGGQFRIYNMYKNLSKYAQIDYICYDGNSFLPENSSLSEGFKCIKVPKGRIQRELELLGGRLFTKSSINDIAASLIAQADPTFMLELRNSIFDSDVVVSTHPYLYSCIKEIVRNRKVKVYESLNCEYMLKKGMFDPEIDSSLLTSLVYNVEKTACEDGDIVLVVSEEDRFNLSKIYNISLSKIHIIPNGVDTESILPCTEVEKKISKKKLELTGYNVILFIGSAHLPNKDAAVYVLELAALLPTKIFIIVGSVGYLLRDKNIPSNVKILYEVGEDMKLSIFQATDIALNPMVSGSGTNLKMLDYMAAGIPIISTPIGARGLDIVAGEHAIVSDINTFDANIMKLMNDKDLYAKLRQQGRSLVDEKYGWKIIAKKYIDILENALLRN